MIGSSAAASEQIRSDRTFTRPLLPNYIPCIHLSQTFLTLFFCFDQRRIFIDNITRCFRDQSDLIWSSLVANYILLLHSWAFFGVANILKQIKELFSLGPSMPVLNEVIFEILFTWELIAFSKSWNEWILEDKAGGTLSLYHSLEWVILNRGGWLSTMGRVGNLSQDVTASM